MDTIANDVAINNNDVEPPKTVKKEPTNTTLKVNGDTKRKEIDIKRDMPLASEKKSDASTSQPAKNIKKQSTGIALKVCNDIKRKRVKSDMQADGEKSSERCDSRIPMFNMGSKTPNKPAPQKAAIPQKRTLEPKISLLHREAGGSNKKPDTIPIPTKQHSLIEKTTKKQKLAPAACKSLTARESASTGITRRSVSAISCTKAKNDKPEESVSTYSVVGDQDIKIRTSRSRVAENNKIKVFENLAKKLTDIQTEFMLKYDTLKLSSPEKIKSKYKFIAVVRNDESKLLINESDALKLPRKLPAKSVHDFKEDMKNILESCLINFLHNLKNVEFESLFEGKDAVFQNLQSKLKDDQAAKLDLLNETITSLFSTKENVNDAHTQKLELQVLEYTKSFAATKEAVQKEVEGHLNEIESLKKQVQAMKDDEKAKDSQITDLQKRIKFCKKQHEELRDSLHDVSAEKTKLDTTKAKLSEELMSCRDSLSIATKKLSHCEIRLTQEKRENAQKVELWKKLQLEFQICKEEMEDLRTKWKAETDRQTVHRQEIEKLRTELGQLVADRTTLQEEIKRMKEELESLRITQTELQDANAHIATLQMKFEQYKMEQVCDIPPELQAEFENLSLNYAEKTKELETVAVELQKAQFTISQLNEQIERDHHLLEVRGELISSLQDTDNNHHNRLEQVLVQVSDKNSIINEVGISNIYLNSELRTKSEEFRNLFNTLSNKQFELSRMQHMIKLLEESNERNQMLRVKQEEKIVRMEEEISKLKHSRKVDKICVNEYTGSKKLLFAPVIPTDDYNSNFFYFTAERKHKRQKDICVKKYSI